MYMLSRICKGIERWPALGTPGWNAVNRLARTDPDWVDLKTKGGFCLWGEHINDKSKATGLAEEMLILASDVLEGF